MKPTFSMLMIIGILLVATGCSSSGCPNAPALSLVDMAGYYAVMETNHARHPRLSILHLTEDHLEWYDLENEKTVTDSHQADIEASGDHGYTTQVDGQTIAVCMTAIDKDTFRFEVQNHPEAMGTKVYYKLLRLYNIPPEVRKYRGQSE